MLVGLMAAVLLVISLSAFTVAPAKSTSLVKSPQAALTIPHVAITTIAGKYNYSLSKITVKIVNNPEFTIKNKTTITQVITYKGGRLATLPPGAIDSIHISPKGTYIYGLESNSKAKLTIVVQ